MVAFSQGRLVHRLAIAAEDAGFEIRDLFVWEHEGGQGKAFTQDHFVKKMDLSAKQRAAIVTKLDRRKTPQLRPKFEPYRRRTSESRGIHRMALACESSLVRIDSRGLDHGRRYAARHGAGRCAAR